MDASRRPNSDRMNLMQGQALLQKIPRHEITGSPSFRCELFSTFCVPFALFGRVSNFSRQYDFKQMCGNMGLELGIHRKSKKKFVSYLRLCVLNPLFILLVRFELVWRRFEELREQLRGEREEYFMRYAKSNATTQFPPVYP